VSVVWLLVLLVGAYVLGSMPWGFWIVRWVKHDDIRKHGSGNTGATNVWRTYGPRLGLPVVLLDIAKGLIPTLIGLYAFGPTVAVLAGALAVIGHTWPIFLGLSGGKGVATGTGVVIAICPLCFAIIAVVWLVVLWASRYVSLASMSGAVAFLVTAILVDGRWPTIVFAALGVALILWRHRTNIGRLRAGTENRVQSFGRGRPQRA
jgi:glycerol-3-phosphate acyltransferase PlsY